MSSVLGLSPTTFSRLNRREALRVGLAGVSALGLPELARLRTLAETVGQKNPRTAVLIVWLPGGASHIETYDPKPQATSEYRGPFSPIKTAVPGMELCELLPHHARVADKFSLLRSLVHTGFCHQQGTHQLLTGHPVRELRNKPDDPDLFCIANYLRNDPSRDLPNYVGVPGINYSGAAYLGGAYEPFQVHGDLSQPKFSVPNLSITNVDEQARLGERLDLQKQFDRTRREIDRLGQMQALDAFQEQAWHMLTGDAARKAFDLSQEDPQLRDKYGRNSWGQQLLMGRRLVEAGVDLVTVQLGGPLCGRIGNWDDHAVNFHCFEAMKYRCPPYDQGVAALIEDIFDRGLDQRVMVIVTGEFGRTPKINYQASTGEGKGSMPEGIMQPGRDHWPGVTSLLFAGGGIPGGQIIGASDSRGEIVKDRQVGTGDFLATIYRHLGIDAERIALTNFSGRPVPILPQGGTPIAELTRG